jgi:hypothetical protein
MGLLKVRAACFRFGVLYPTLGDGYFVVCGLESGDETDGESVDDDIVEADAGRRRGERNGAFRGVRRRRLGSRSIIPLLR